MYTVYRELYFLYIGTGLWAISEMKHHPQFHLRLCRVFFLLVITVYCQATSLIIIQY